MSPFSMPFSMDHSVRSLEKPVLTLQTQFFVQVIIGEDNGLLRFFGCFDHDRNDFFFLV